MENLAYADIRLTPEETEKLDAFQNMVDASAGRRFRVLRQRLEQESLTPQEHQELAALTEKFEGINAERLELLAEIARYRNLSLADIMRFLNIRPLLS